MIHLHTQHLNYLIFAVAAIVMVVFLFKKWDFISQALSEPDTNGNFRGSSRRMIAFLLAFTICFNETYTTLKSQAFELSHLYAILITIFLCLGLATFPQILEAWKGKQPDNKPADPAQQ